jgi:N6-L-threonylcarbamoyladenine synthase
MIEDVCEILPISKIVIESSQFDTQKLKDPNITGFEYQQGDQWHFWNAREYVLFRDDHKCQHCHGKSGDNILNAHHIESRQTGGDSPGNLVTLCDTCHDLFHKGKIEISIKRMPSYRDAAFMGIMRKALLKRVREKHPDITVEETFGYIMFLARQNDGKRLKKRGRKYDKIDSVKGWRRLLSYPADETKQVDLEPLRYDGKGANQKRKECEKT